MRSTQSSRMLASKGMHFYTFPTDIQFHSCSLADNSFSSANLASNRSPTIKSSLWSARNKAGDIAKGLVSIKLTKIAWGRVSGNGTLLKGRVAQCSP